MPTSQSWCSSSTKPPAVRQAPKALLEKIEQVVRLIRSKAWRVLHQPEPARHPGRRTRPARPSRAACAACVHPEGPEAVKPRPNVPRAQGLRCRNRDHRTRHRRGAGLGAGRERQPTPVARILVRPPESRIGPLTEAERAEHMKRSPPKAAMTSGRSRVGLRAAEQTR